MVWLTRSSIKEMPDREIFCNTPWYSVHIYWDGSLGICCQEDHKPYQAGHDYNIANMSIKDWFNSEPVRQFRLSMLRPHKMSACRSCYEEEDSHGYSRRIRSNSKSVIFTRQAFTQSFQQSPAYPHFIHSADNQGWTNTSPIDLHIDLGNHCNLACKMCIPSASSTIASQHVRWGIESSRQYLGTDWTRNERVWKGFLQQLIEIPGLKNLHLMGGETLLTRKFEELVDWFIAHGRYDICFSFVTNGTIYPSTLMDKLKRFARVGIEVSIETMTEHNLYQRQGTDNALVMHNIQRLRAWCDRADFTVALRPAISVLTIGHYHTLLEYAIRNQLVIKSLLCVNPEFMRPEMLPITVKRFYLERLERWAQTIDWPACAPGDYNASDPNNAALGAHDQVRMIKSLLQLPCPADSDQQLERLIRHCERWDKVYGLDMRSYYPEFAEILEQHGYAL